MKTFKLVFTILFIVGLLTGCSKDDSVSDLNNDLMLKKASLSPVFVVEPNGTDDTENLKNAFADAQAAGPGAVVQLCEGEYHLGFLQIYDFEGSLKGAGKDNTIITALNNLDILSLWDLNLRADLVKFVGGDVHLSQFTIQTPPGKVAVSGTTGFIGALFNFSSGNAIMPANENSFINVEIDNVRFLGQPMEEGGIHGSNCAFGVRVGYDWVNPINLPREKVNLNITNSEFDTFFYGLILDGVTSGTVVLGKSGHGNVFSNTSYSGGVFESRDMKIFIQGNTFNISKFGLFLDINTPWMPTTQLAEQPQTQAAVCNVENNTFILSKANCGLWMKDYRRRTHPEELPVVFQVKSNSFQLSEGRGSAMRCRWTNGTVIRNNKIEGYGAWGIQIDSPGGEVYNENGLLLGNNFANATFKKGSVRLTAYTKNWTLVGGNVGETVVDDGVNNIITGFTNQTSEIPLGQTIVDNLDEMRSFLQDIK